MPPWASIDEKKKEGSKIKRTNDGLSIL